MSNGYDPERFWEITPRENKLLVEAAARRWEREHNGRAWLAWHTAFLPRAKRPPDIKKMFIKNTSKPRQTWQEQLAVITGWAVEHNNREEMKRKLTNGR